MAIRKKPETSKVKIMKVKIPEDLADELTRVRKLAKEKGLVFDTKPEIHKALKQAIKAALAEIGEKSNADVASEE